MNGTGSSARTYRGRRRADAAALVVGVRADLVRRAGRVEPGRLNLQLDVDRVEVLWDAKEP